MPFKNVLQFLKGSHPVCHSLLGKNSKDDIQNRSFWKFISSRPCLVCLGLCLMPIDNWQLCICTLYMYLYYYRNLISRGGLLLYLLITDVVLALVNTGMFYFILCAVSWPPWTCLLDAEAWAKVFTKLVGLLFLYSIYCLPSFILSSPNL